MFGSLNDILEAFLMSWQPSWCFRSFLYVLGTLSMFWQSSWCCGSFLDVLVTFLMSCHLCWCIGSLLDVLGSLLGLLCSILDVLGYLLDVMPPLLMYWQPSWCAWKPWQTCVLDFQCLLLLDVMFLSWCYYYLHCLSLVDCRYWTYYRHTVDILWDTMGYYGHTIGGLTVAVGARWSYDAGYRIQDTVGSGVLLSVE